MSNFITVEKLARLRRRASNYLVFSFFSL